MSIYVRVTDVQGETKQVEGIEGYSVMEVIRDHGLPIKAECGGCMCCATCAVDVAPHWLDHIPARGRDEEDMLVDAGLPVTPSTRLSCQIVLQPALDGIEVALLPLDDHDGF